ncbi:hypothetical protein Ple7327_1842 [Pleurocapsa sp. PCC 7327]|nr:hypothetical protein Ple7327_1842 [Pleurocapsa sp. PCC 7327]
MNLINVRKTIVDFLVHLYYNSFILIPRRQR